MGYLVSELMGQLVQVVVIIYGFMVVNDVSEVIVLGLFEVWVNSWLLEQGFINILWVGVNMGV